MAGLSEDQVTLYRKELYKAVWMDTDPEPTAYDKIYTVIKATGAGDKKDQLLGLGDLKKMTTETENIEYSSPTPGWGYYVNYFRFTDGLILSYEAVKDTIKVTNLIKDLASTWDMSVRHEKETFAALPINNGGTTAGHSSFDGTHTGQTDPSGIKAYDSVCLLNLTGNPRTSKGGVATYYNAIAAISLSVANFETLYNLATATNNVDELDRPMRNRPDLLLTQVGADAVTAWKLLETSGVNNSLPGGSLNDRNPFSNGKSYIGNMDHIAWDYITDTSSPFYLINRKLKAMEFHERENAETDFWEDKRNKSYCADIMMRMGTRITDFRAIHRGGGTSA